LISVVQGGGSATSADLSLLEDIAEACDFPVLTVGGVMTMNDLSALEHRGVSAVVLGSVLYSAALDARAVAQEFSSSAALLKTERSTIGTTRPVFRDRQTGSRECTGDRPVARPRDDRAGHRRRPDSRRDSRPGRSARERGRSPGRRSSRS